MKSKIYLIEFLRGISVISVILYHYFPKIFPLGYLGVDIFFVISGYVITKSLLLKKSSWATLKNFYNKRIHRLLPILYIVLTFTLLMSVIFDTPHATKNIGQGIIATILYLANIFYYTEIDYFDTFQANSPLVHTWSLSLEEQFYIFFPMIMLTLRKNKLRIIVFTSILLLSLIFYLNGTDELYKHYMPHFRIWQLLFGTLLALSNKIYYNNYVHFASVFCILFILFSQDIISPSALIVIFATSSLLVRPKKEYYNYKLVFYSGALSYGLYLWHQPIMYFNSLFWDKSFVNFLIIIFTIVIISYFSNKFIENKFRYKITNISLLVILGISVFLLSLGYKAHSSRGYYTLKSYIYDVKNDSININYDDLLIKRSLIRESIIKLPVQDSSILIIGDSKSEDLLCSLFKVKNIRYNQVEIHANDYDEKSFFADQKILKSIEQADRIIFTNTWQRENLNNVRDVINKVASIPKKKVYVISTANFEDLTSQYFGFFKQNLNNIEILKKLNKSARFDWQRQSDELKEKLKKNKNVVWIDKKEAFIGERNGFCINNELTIYDTGHLTSAGFPYFGNWILPKIGL